MRYYFRRRIPDFERLLLIESGSRRIAEAVRRTLCRSYGDSLAMDLVTCYDGVPEGCDPANTRLFHIAGYQGRAGRKRLYDELASGYPVVGVICSAEPIMTKWKWALAARLPAKIFVVNENADYFWLDYSNWRITAYFALFRAGLAGPGAVRNLARVALFPVTLGFLLCWAATVHMKRALRRLMRLSTS